MDLNAILIGAGIFVLCAVVIYLISAVTMREKTYEEVMEEQRHRHAEITGKTKQEKKEKKSKKKVKGTTKKDEKRAEERTDTTEDDTVDSAETHKMVQYDPDPEIIEVTSTSPPPPAESSVKQRKTKKDKQKPILVNREEKSLVKETSGKTGENLVADKQYHKATVPLDDLELKHERERKDSERSSQHEHAVEETLVKVVSASTQQSSPRKSGTEPGAKKGKSKKQHAEPALPPQNQLGSFYSEVLSMIQKSQLTPYEIQTLTDELLSKQTGSQEWTKNSKKSDPVAALSRQLAEQTSMFNEAKTELVTYSEKNKELRQELHQEKQRCNVIEKQTREKADGQHAEIQALHSRMQHTHEQHTAEVTSLRRQLEQSKMNDLAVSQLREENRSLKQAHQQTQVMATSQAELTNLQQQRKILQDELSRTVMLLNASENSKQILETEVKKYKSEVKHMSTGQRENEAVLSKKMNEISEELRRTEAKNEELKRSTDSAKGQTQKAEQEVANLRNSLKSLQDSQTSSDKTIKDLQAKLQEKDQQSAELQNRLSASDKDLQSQATKATQQEAGKISELQTTVATLQKSLSEKEQQVKTLSTEKESFSTQVASLEATVAEQKAVTAVTVTTLQSAASGDSNKKVEDLEKNHLEVLKTKDEEIEKLKKDIAAQKDKNNALRQRGWKAMEALNDADKRLEKYVGLKSELDARDKTIAGLETELNAARQHQTAVSQQLQSGEGELKLKLTKAEQQVDTLGKQLQEMQQEKSKSSALWEQVQQLQGQLAEKEKELSTVQGHVETVSKQNQDLSNAQTEKQTLQQEVTSLKASLEQVQSQNKSKESELQALADEIETLKKHSTNLEQQKKALEDSQFESEDQLNTEVANLQLQLKESQARQQEITSVNEEHSTSYSSYSEQVLMEQRTHSTMIELHTTLEKRTAEIALLQQALTSREKRIKALEDMTDPGHGPTYSKLLKELQTKARDLETKERDIYKLQGMVKTYAREKNELSEKLSKLEKTPSENDSNPEELASKSKEIENLLNSLKQTQDELAKKEEVLRVKDTQLFNLDSRLQGTQTELKEAGGQLTQLKVQLERLASHDTQLMQCKTQIHDLEKQNASLQQNVSDRIAQAENQTSQHYQQLLQRLHPEIKVTSSTYTEFVQRFEKEIVHIRSSPQSNDNSAFEQRLQESEETQTKLQNQVQHYKTVLSDTEGILNRLQSSVEAEEKRWQQKLDNTESDLIKARQDAQRFHDELKSIKGSKEDLTDLNFAYRCVEKSLTNIVDEMEEKLVDLENKLVETTSEKQQLEEKLSQLNATSLENQLSSEQKKVKELTTEKVKLSSIVKMGQDALKQEQDLVKQLQEKLSTKGLANGTSDSSEVTQELQQ